MISPTEPSIVVAPRKSPETAMPFSGPGMVCPAAQNPRVPFMRREA